VSRLWPERLLVSLAPCAVHGVRLAGMPWPRLVEKRHAEADPDLGPRAWDGAVQALGSLVTRWGHLRARATVVVSNHFVRYLTVPHMQDARSAEEELAVARFHFTRVHGGRAREWDIRVERKSGEGPRLASALDTALLNALHAALGKVRGPRLVSVQPYLMSGFNGRKRDVPPEGGWFVLPERGRTCVALLERNNWAGVTLLREAVSSAPAALSVVERERTRMGGSQAPRKVLLVLDSSVAADAEDSSPCPVIRLRPRFLPGIDSMEDLGYAMALSAR
jgi:hypothetical protein